MIPDLQSHGGMPHNVPIYDKGNVLVRQPLRSNGSAPPPIFPKLPFPPLSTQVADVHRRATAKTCGWPLDRVPSPPPVLVRKQGFGFLCPGVCHVPCSGGSQDSFSCRWGVRLANVGRPARRRRLFRRPVVGLMHRTGHQSRGHDIHPILAAPAGPLVLLLVQCNRPEGFLQWPHIVC